MKIETFIDRPSMTERYLIPDIRIGFDGRICRHAPIERELILK